MLGGGGGGGAFTCVYTIIHVGRKLSAELLPSECAVRIVSVMYCCTEQEQTRRSLLPCGEKRLLLVTVTVQMEKEKKNIGGKLQCFCCCCFLV